MLRSCNHRLTCKTVYFGFNDEATDAEDAEDAD